MSSWLSGFERRLRVCVERNVTVLSLVWTQYFVLLPCIVWHRLSGGGGENSTGWGSGMVMVFLRHSSPALKSSHPELLVASQWATNVQPASGSRDHSSDSRGLRGQFQRPHSVTCLALGNVCATAVPPLRHHCVIAVPPLHPCADGWGLNQSTCASGDFLGEVVNPSLRIQPAVHLLSYENPPYRRGLACCNGLSVGTSATPGKFNNTHILWVSLKYFPLAKKYMVWVHSPKFVSRFNTHLSSLCKLAESNRKGFPTLAIN